MAFSEEANAGVDLDEYKTPLGKLARRFKASLEQWKSKHHDLKGQIKYFQNRAADACRSRDHWKEKTQQWKASAQQLQAELDCLRAETADPKSKRAKSS
jgi:uncharacterized coiled-coil DUF342 family protein